MRLVVIISMLLTLSACLTQRLAKERTATNEPSILHNPASLTPPNSIKINDTLFADWTENSNAAWKEYVYDLGNHFGIESDRYLDALPRDIGNLKIFNVDSLLTQDSGISRARYFLFGEYDQYPVTGITLDQAKAYSKWRSDRVLYGYLINVGVLEYSKDSFFTIESFLATEEYQRHADIITHYPEFFIPTLDHIDQVKVSLKMGQIGLGDMHTLNTAIEKQHSSYLPCRKVAENDGQKSHITLHNLAGNVCEMVDEENLVFGGSYLNTDEELKDLPIQKTDLPNEMVGFRNFCRWVEIEIPEVEETDVESNQLETQEYLKFETSGK